VTGGAPAGKRYRKYSLGMRQRLGLAAALLRPRDLLVLDEPTNGLDPQGTREVRHLLREASAEGATVFVSSHLLSEIEQICTDVGVMSHGKLVFQGSLPELRAAAGVRVRVETSQPQAAAEVLTRLGTGRPELRPDGVVAELGSGLNADRRREAGLRRNEIPVARHGLDTLDEPNVERLGP